MKTIALDGVVWELPYWDLLPPLSETQYQDLKEDICDKGGNLYPVLWRRDTGGTRRVIDGGHRLRAVAELRAEGDQAVSLAEQVLEVADEEEERQAALDLNLKRRHLSPEQRAEWVARLRQEGLSTRRIAEVVGVDPKTVRNDIRGPGGDNSPPGIVRGKDGKSYPAQRPVSSPAGEHQVPRLSISTPEERAAISGPALYDEAEARKEEHDNGTDGQQRERLRSADGVRGYMAESSDTPPDVLARGNAEGGQENQSRTAGNSSEPHRRTQAETGGAQPSVTLPSPEPPPVVSENKKGACSICGAEPYDEGYPYCMSHEAKYSSEYWCCRMEGCERWVDRKTQGCSLHGGLDYIPRIEEEPTEECTGVTETCQVSECGECARRDCPQGSEWHYHHDGCGACAEAEEEGEEDRRKGAPAIMASQRDDHNTPEEILVPLRLFAPIALDPCSNRHSTVGARVVLTIDDDGLHADWVSLTQSQDHIFINPPYAQEALALVHRRARYAASCGRIVSTLVPAKTDQDWYQDVISGGAAAVCFVSGRVRFWVDGQRQQGAAFPCLLVYYGPRAWEWCETIKDIGACVMLSMRSLSIDEERGEKEGAK